MIKLPIPYRSQWDADAGNHAADCGPTCLAMILNYFGIDMTADGVYNYLPPKEPDDFTFFHELISASTVNRVDMTYRSYDNRSNALNNLRSNLEAQNPLITLVKYAPWQNLTGNVYQWGHFVVVAGYDDNHIYIHDPLFGLWQPRSKGANFALTYDDFCAGWAGFNGGENPNWACVIAGNVIDYGQPIPPPAPPSPPVVTPPLPSPTPIPPASEAVVPGTHVELTPEVRQRIFALAAYRWAEKPNLDDPQQAQLWLTHLGDWGQTTTVHTVGAGDTLVGLAGRYYGEQHRWRAIYIYNNLNREGLWRDERLTIPLVGSSGAHLNSTLPSDTLDLIKSLDLDSLIDPEVPSQDYNDLGAKSVGIGFLHGPEMEKED